MQVELEADLFELSLLKEDVSSIEVSKGVVWIQSHSNLIVPHCINHIPCELCVCVWGGGGGARRSYQVSTTCILI